MARQDLWDAAMGCRQFCSWISRSGGFVRAQLNRICWWAVSGYWKRVGLLYMRYIIQIFLAHNSLIICTSWKHIHARWGFWIGISWWYLGRPGRWLVQDRLIRYTTMPRSCVMSSSWFWAPRIFKSRFRMYHPVLIAWRGYRVKFWWTCCWSVASCSLNTVLVNSDWREATKKYLGDSPKCGNLQNKNKTPKFKNGLSRSTLPRMSGFCNRWFPFNSQKIQCECGLQILWPNLWSGITNAEMQYLSLHICNQLLTVHEIVNRCWIHTQKQISTKQTTPDRNQIIKLLEDPWDIWIWRKYAQCKKYWTRTDETASRW